MKRLTITNPEVTITSLRAELGNSSEKRKAIRILGLIKLLEGKQNIETAEFLECHRASLSTWVKRVNAEGLSGLDEKPGRGLKSRLSEQQKDQLKKDLTYSPKEFGFNSSLWSGKILIAHIKNKYHVEYHQAMTYILFKELGFTLQRPTREYLGADPIKQQEFKENLKKNNPTSR